MKEALFYSKLTDNSIRCELCPHYCVIQKNQLGICRVRKNINNELFSLNYGEISSLHLDPIEKKPLFHYYPGSMILSIGSYGCNMKCIFCQNWEISQHAALPIETDITISQIIQKAKVSSNNIGIAYTYNEPTIWFEYMLDIAKEAKKHQLKNVMVTNGYINPKPLSSIIEVIDAFNVDLKAFDLNFYKKYTHAQLDPILENIKTINKNNRHIELTFLLIPNLNDNPNKFEEMVKWIASEINPDTVLHISRYFPMYKCSEPTTPLELLDYFYEIAHKHLNYVYIGNINYENHEKSTYCSKCFKEVITRKGYYTELTGITADGKCRYCLNQIIKDI